jgi:putative phosphoribosyl transferase
VTSIEDSPAPAPSGARFRDRREAGRRLAALLEGLAVEGPVVVGIPRGGVPVAAEVARALGAPLDVVVVCKIGAPQNPEFAIGALAQGGVRVLNRRTVRALGLDEPELRAVEARVRGELEDRVDRYRGARPPVPLSGRVAILVDDGLATGSSAAAAVESLRRQGAARVILAVPVAARESAEALRERAEEVVCVETPPDLWAVGMWYENFEPTTDEEVARLLADSAKAAIEDVENMDTR